MTGITKQAQLAMLQSQTVGLGTSGSSRTLYLHFFVSASVGAGQEPNEDGTLPTGLTEIGGGLGYAPVALHSNDITFSAGPPTTASFPNGSGTGGAALGFTATGSVGDISAVGISPDSGAWVPANALYTGPIVDGSGNPIAPTIGNTDVFQFTSTNPLIVRLGDPEPGTVPI